MTKLNRLKTVIASVLFSFAILGASAQESTTRIEQGITANSNENFENNLGKGSWMVYFSLSDLGHAKNSGSYGFSDILSIIQKGNDHLCLSFSFGANYGFTKDGGIIAHLGPAYRRDFSKTTSIAIPLELTGYFYPYTDYSNSTIGETKTKSIFGGQLSAILMIKPEKVAFFIGPLLAFDKHNTSIGATFGIGF